MQIANFSLFWTIFFTLGSLILAYILKLLYKTFIRPQLNMRFYKKQGIPSFYFPFIGRYSREATSLNKHGDGHYYSKHTARDFPSRALCSNIGFDASLVLREPALVKEFCLHPENYVKDTDFLELYTPLLGKGLLTSEGSRWKAQRKTLSSTFHFEFLKSNLPVTQATAHEILSNLHNASLTDVNIMDVFQSITGEVIGKIFFGEQLNQFQLDGKPLTLALADLISQIARLNVSIDRFVLGPWFIMQGFFPKHKKLMNKAYAFRDICGKIIEARKKIYYSQKPEERKKGMLEVLLEYSGEEGKVSEEDIIDQFSTFFLAGMDTTGHLVTMAVYYLQKYPEMREKMISEIKQHYKVGQDVTMDDLNKLEYTMAFLKETLRIMTPITGIFPRRAVKDHMVKDIAIRKGDIVELELLYNNFNEQYFENPDNFNPARWFDKEKSLEAFAFIPFAGGPRNCIGQHLAMIESRIILAEFLTMYDFKLKEGYDFKMVFRFVYEPVNPILLNLTPK